jgi:3',5'-cyclic AMP phosphodiesterase CpdA
VSENQGVGSQTAGSQGVGLGAAHVTGPRADQAARRAHGDRTFVLAHLSDPHLGPMPRPRMAELASKRIFGYINWQRSRRAIHRLDALAAIDRDLRRQHPDHVAVTGDLVNIALAPEFVRARQWLESLGVPADVSLVPGNHDAYVHAAALHRDRHWAPYMTGDAGAASFPYVRRRGPVALVGLSTAVATPPLIATGRLGDAQIARAGAILAELGAARLFRVVMIHHPPLAPPASRHKWLTDAAAFRRAIAAAGAELVIHGHEHVHARAAIPGKGAMVPVIGVPSASAASGRSRDAAAYNLYRIAGEPGAFACEVISRGLGPTGAVVELNRFELSWNRRA